MNLLPLPTASDWRYASPSRGQGEVVDGKFLLSGAPLSYGVFRCETPLACGWARLEAACQTEGLASPETAATVMISFFTADGSPLRRQYADAKQGEAPGALRFSRLYKVPEGTAYCSVELALRWPLGGRAAFDRPGLMESEPPAERLARIVVTNFHRRTHEIAWPDRISALFDAIGPCGPDLICLSEMVHLRDKPGSPREAAESIDGQFTACLSGLAVKHNTYVIGNFLESDQGDLFNTSVLIDRNGGLAGLYRKTHLPLSEVEGGSSPGSIYPVFDTDFASVGLVICWDLAFPEPMRLLRLNGAELAVCASMGDFWPQDSVRARDNGLWLAVAGTDQQPSTPFPPSRIYDPTGKLIAAACNGQADSFAFADVDFNRRYYQYWASVGPCDGEPPSLFVTERRPETYLLNRIIT